MRRLTIAALLALAACASAPPAPLPFLLPAPSPAPRAAWSAPEAVTIRGYTGPAEDPALSPDGSLMFFDSHADGAPPAKLFWARMIDYKTAAFMGEVGGINQPGQPSIVGTMDAGGLFYFTTGGGGGPVIMRGLFSNGAVSQVAAVKGFPPPSALPPWQPRQVVHFPMSSDITPDGAAMYVSDFQVTVGANGQLSPTGGAIVRYTRNPDGSFVKAADSDAMLGLVNALTRKEVMPNGPQPLPTDKTVPPVTGAKILYGAVEAADGLSLYFSGSDIPGSCGTNCGVSLYVAHRASAAAPFGVPQRIVEAPGIVEAPFPSSGEQHLYYHRMLGGGQASVFVLTRH